LEARCETVSADRARSDPARAVLVGNAHDRANIAAARQLQPFVDLNTDLS